MNMDEVLPTFIAESEEVLRDLESGLLACAQGQADAETINLLFRAVHTLKGSAGLFGLDGIVAFVHDAETTLDQVRQGHVPMDRVLVGILLRCKDHIKLLLDSPVVLSLSQLDDRYFKGLEGQYHFRLQFRVHEQDRPGAEDYVVRSSATYLMNRSVAVEIPELQEVLGWHALRRLTVAEIAPANDNAHISSEAITIPAISTWKKTLKASVCTTPK